MKNSLTHSKRLLVLILLCAVLLGAFRAEQAYGLAEDAAPAEEGYEDSLAASDRHGALTINEAVSHNASFSKQKGKYYDWVELKNTGEDAIHLGDYYLSDNADKLQKYRLPDLELKAGGLFLVFCSGDSSLGSKTLFHANFAIGADETLYLSAQDGTISDQVHVHDIPLNGSIGRMDGCDGFWYFASPTPERENGQGYREVSSAPSASVAQGVYNGDEPLTVELSGNGAIYYTLDGSVPDRSDPQYLSPIEVTSTTILRAVCEEDGKLPSQPATFSYILNEQDSLPVTSLVCEPADMFGAYGVYYADRLMDAKCDANVSFFDTNGEGFSSDCSVELHGAHSRTSYDKKSFELKFAARYGGPVEYDLFGDGNVTAFSSLLLRGGSSVKLDTVRDCFASKLVYEVCPTLYPQNMRYTAVYINGKYHGLYAWREAYSGAYFEDHADARAKKVSMARAPLASGELLELFNTITTHNMADSEMYESVSALLDLDSLAGWMAIEAYFDNQDINGNIRYVKLAEDGKWQMVLYDLDYSCLTELTGWATVMASYQVGPVCKALLASPDFRELLLQKCAALCQNGLTTDNVQRIYDELLLQLDDEAVAKDCARWNDDFSKWEANTKALRERLSEARMRNWLENLKALTKASDEQMHRYFPGYD